MMRRLIRMAGVALMACAAGAVACSRPAAPPAASTWTLAPESAAFAQDETLRNRIFRALNEAERAGTDPSISKFQVRCATVVGGSQGDRVILGGNSEYAVPEAIHGETSIMNHAITLLGAQAAKDSVRFLAFYGETCGGGGSCGDCRDYLMQTTRYRDLIIACGQARDHTVHLQRFSDAIVPEESAPEVGPGDVRLDRKDLDRLVEAASAARRGGVALFTQPKQHLGVAALSHSGRLYRAAAADDAAFHYRYPIGGVLQQAATEQDYFIKAIAVAGEPGGGDHAGRQRFA